MSTSNHWLAERLRRHAERLLEEARRDSRAALAVVPGGAILVIIPLALELPQLLLAVQPLFEGRRIGEVVVRPVQASNRWAAALRRGIKRKVRLRLPADWAGFVSSSGLGKQRATQEPSQEQLELEICQMQQVPG